MDYAWTWAGPATAITDCQLVSYTLHFKAICCIFLWNNLLFTSHADDVKRELRAYPSRLLANQKQEPALAIG